MLLPFAARDNW